MATRRCIFNVNSGTGMIILPLCRYVLYLLWRPVYFSCVTIFGYAVIWTAY